ncbi:MAG: GDSL-type esterase/lipase family protein [Clostridia bacterium]|nr:GDSL-type esterase/lipase family protein [Clostridia bacterium]
MKKIDKFITPGDYSPGTHVDADTRRCEFDIKNEQIFFGREKPKIVFAGDSITHYCEVNRFYNKYGFVINRGIGGDMAHIMAWRFTADVTQLSPRLCIMLVGVNNTWYMDEHIDREKNDFDAAEKRECKALIEQSFRKMLEEAKEYGFDLWICSELPLGEDIVNKDIRNRYIIEINEMLKGLAKEYNTTYVDYHSALCKEDGLTMLDGISRDCLHPKSNGYELMKGVLEPLLDEYFSK